MHCSKRIACLFGFFLGLNLALLISCGGGSSSTQSYDELISSGPNPSIPGLSIYSYTISTGEVFELPTCPADCRFETQDGGELTTYNLYGSTISFEEPVIACTKSSPTYEILAGKNLEEDQNITFGILYTNEGGFFSKVTFLNTSTIDLTSYGMSINLGEPWGLLFSSATDNQFTFDLSSGMGSIVDLLALQKNNISLFGLDEDHTLKTQISFSWSLIDEGVSISPPNKGLDNKTFHSNP